jgi:hypothetical protein
MPLNNLVQRHTIPVVFVLGGSLDRFDITGLALSPLVPPDRFRSGPAFLRLVLVATEATLSGRLRVERGGKRHAAMSSYPCSAFKLHNHRKAPFYLHLASYTNDYYVNPLGLFLAEQKIP